MNSHTHYDNLKVSRDAPPEVIRAAYKTLSQKYHPDKNLGDERSATIMQIINASYEVLSNPERRKAYDNYLRREALREMLKQAAAENRVPAQPAQTQEKPAAPPSKPKTPRPSFFTRYKMGVGDSLVWSVVGIVLIAVLYTDAVETKQAPSRPTASTPAKVATSSPSTPSRDQAQSPMCGPAMSTRTDGKPWPAAAAEIKRGPGSGLSNVTIDNSRGSSNIYVKLARPHEGNVPGLREAYIPSGQSFTLPKIPRGTYVVKYKDIKTGCNAKSDPFNVEEYETGSGTSYSNITLTIYTVANGNMHFDRIPEASF